jgi:tripeptide aminopeptidase
MLKEERLAETFRSLVAISSVSRCEGALALHLKERFDQLGAETVFDGSAAFTGSDTGNLIARFAGTRNAPALLLSAHMDTVQPGEGIKALFKDGVFTSDGTTILGADDKSAIAVILEALSVLEEDRIAHGPIEVALTTCEETGLAGARNLDLKLITASYGYALDGSDTEGVIVQAPSANRFEIRLIGRDAHAGAHPEKGINAIHLAAKAMAGLTIGRIDRETTCNIGWIEGGLPRTWSRRSSPSEGRRAATTKPSWNASPPGSWQRSSARFWSSAPVRGRMVFRAWRLKCDGATPGPAFPRITPS